MPATRGHRPPDRSPHAWRARRAAREAHDRAASWRFARATARVRVVDGVLADYATSFCGRPVRRSEAAPMQSSVQLPGITWSIDGDLMVEFLYEDTGPSRLVIHEIALLRPLRKQLRSKHVTIEHGPSAR
jgi:hypothetical protein